MKHILCLDVTLVNWKISQKLQEAVRWLGRGQLCSCKLNTLCNPMKRDRERALIGGQLLDGFECSYSSKPHIIGLDDEILQQMILFCRNQNVNCPNTQGSAPPQRSLAEEKLKLQQKQELEFYRSGVSAGCYIHFHSCSSKSCSLFSHNLHKDMISHHQFTSLMPKPVVIYYLKLFYSPIQNKEPVHLIFKKLLELLEYCGENVATSIFVNHFVPKSSQHGPKINGEIVQSMKLVVY